MHALALPRPIPLLRSNHESALYVGEDRRQREAVSRILGTIAREVTTAASGLAAIELLAEAPQNFTLVVVDAKCGDDIDGFMLLSEVRELAPGAVRIAIAGTSDVFRLAQSSHHAMADEIITRPWNLEQLSSLLLRAIDLADRARDDARELDTLARRAKRLEDQRQRLNGRLLELTVEVLEAFLSAMALRGESRAHAHRVAGYACRIAAQVGLHGHDLIDLEYGALLHDVGKIGVSDGLVDKTEPLTTEEWTEMKAHPRLGYGLLSRVQFLSGAADIVLQHHEWFDGTGYPNGLSGEMITMGARVVAVADALDAITTGRHGRRAQSFEDALAEIERCAGSQFDPDVVVALLTVPVRELSMIQKEFAMDPGAGWPC